MKILLVILFISNFFVIASEQNLTNNQQVLNIDKYQQSVTTEIDKCNLKIDSISNRFDDISASTDKLSIVLTSSITLFGILITIIVLILAFKSRLDAKLEAQEAIKNYIEQEAKKFVDEQLKNTTQQYLEKLHEESNEKINNIIFSLDNYNNIELSIDNKQYLKNQIKSIKMKTIDQRTFDDWQKIILYEITIKSFSKAHAIIDNSIHRNLTSQEKSKLYYLKGFILGRENKLDEAKSYFEKALKLNENYPEAYRKIATILGEKGKYLQAVDYCQKALSYNPNDYQAYNGIGFYYWNLNETKKAIENCNKSITLNPDYRVPYNNLGNIYLDNKEYDKALEYYKKAIEIDDQYQYAYHCIFRLNLITNVDFNKKLVEKFSKNFQNDENYKIFKIVSILKKIKQGKDVSNDIKSWINKYDKVQFRNYLEPINQWIEKEKDLTIKHKLENTIKKFKKSSNKVENSPY